MTEEMIAKIGKVLANKVAVSEMFKDNEEYKGNRRKNPFYSEYQGMIETLKLMGVEVSFDFDKDINPCSVTLNGQTFQIR